MTERMTDLQLTMVTRVDVEELYAGEGGLVDMIDGRGR